MPNSIYGATGSTYGSRFFKPKKCSCGAFFFGAEKECENCFFKRNYAKIGNCVIENSEFRCGKSELTCENYFKCLNTAANRGWDGWRIVKYGDKIKS